MGANSNSQGAQAYGELAQSTRKPELMPLGQQAFTKRSNAISVYFHMFIINRIIQKAKPVFKNVISVHFKIITIHLNVLLQVRLKWNYKQNPTKQILIN